ncbi:MAG: hypothetical protein WAT92_12030 [Saprospiraceae bacterium]
MNKSIGSLVLLCFSFLSAATVIGQKYNTAIGMRFGDDLGISIAQRFHGNYTLQLEHQDALFTTTKQTSLMVKRHYGFLGKRMNVSMGAGGILRQGVNNSEGYVDHVNGGLGFTFGGEFTIGRINVSYDYMPGFVLGQNVEGPRFFSGSGVSLRYVVWQRKGKARETLKKLAFWKKKKK